jgi:hypothetical protein
MTQTQQGPLHREPQIGQRGADLAERRDDLCRRGQQEELAGVARAALQQRRCRIAVGIDLHRIDRDVRGLEVVAGLLLLGVDR